MPPLNMKMQQSATYTFRAFSYSTTLAQIFFDCVWIRVWASCLCPTIIRGFRAHNYSNVFQNFQCFLSKCFVSWYVRRRFYPVTTIVCWVHSSPVVGSLRKQTVLPENICPRICTKTATQKLFRNVQWVRIIEYPSVKWIEILHTLKLLPSISETVVELSIIPFSLTYSILFLCVFVCFMCLCMRFLRHCFSNFGATSFGIPQ